MLVGGRPANRSDGRCGEVSGVEVGDPVEEAQVDRFARCAQLVDELSGELGRDDWIALALRDQEWRAGGRAPRVVLLRDGFPRVGFSGWRAQEGEAEREGAGHGGKDLAGVVQAVPGDAADDRAGPRGDDLPQLCVGA